MKTLSRVYDTYGQARQVVADLKSAAFLTPTSASSPTSMSALNMTTLTSTVARQPGSAWVPRLVVQGVYSPVWV